MFVKIDLLVFTHQSDLLAGVSFFATNVSDLLKVNGDLLDEFDDDLTCSVCNISHKSIFNVWNVGLLLGSYAQHWVRME